MKAARQAYHSARGIFVWPAAVGVGVLHLASPSLKAIRTVKLFRENALMLSGERLNPRGPSTAHSLVPCSASLRMTVTMCCRWRRRLGVSP